jgi:release factor glutamine methyltransferase
VTTARDLVRARATPDAHTQLTRLELQLWLAHVLGVSRARLLAHLDDPVTPEQESRFRAGLARLATGEPLPYLTGRTEFYGLEFAVTPATLIPRPETEHLVEEALARIEQPGAGVTIADVGTGSGCIAVSLAVHRPAVEVYAVDISPDSLVVAAQNAERHRVAGRIHWRRGHLLDPLPEDAALDLIVANLPYVSDPEWADLPVGVRDYEPAGALRGGPAGLDLIRALLGAAPAVLKPGGAILLEIGAAQGPGALALARALLPRAAHIEVRPDYAGRDRILIVHP